MKKNVLLLVTACVSSIGLVQAKDFKLTEDMQFVGSVINDAPQWQWRVNTGKKGRMATWDAPVKDGIKKSGEVVFTYTDQNSQGSIPFVQGLMSSPVAKGGANLTPIVTITNARGKPLVLNGNGEPQEFEVDAVGKLSNGSTTQGVVSLSVESAKAVIYKLGDNWISESYQGASAAEALHFLRDKSTQFYSNSKSGRVIRQNSHNDVFSVLRGERLPQAHSILASFNSRLSNVSTHWQVVPHTWSASINVQIKIQ
ncbi:hypothetical protein ACIMS1_004453 [Vibrio harveyi]